MNTLPIFENSICNKEKEVIDNLTYRFTSNPYFINKYIELRKSLYRQDKKFLGFRIFDYAEAEDYFTDDSKMLIVLNNDTCVGGARLTLSTKKNRIILPLEKDIQPPPGKKTFSLLKKFPEMKLQSHSYGEFNRIVLLPKYRAGIYSEQMFQCILQESLNLGLDYLFGIGDAIRARRYKQIYSKLGYKVNIYSDIEVPNKIEYEGLKMYLMSMQLRLVDNIDTPQQAKIKKPLNFAE